MKFFGTFLFCCLLNLSFGQVKPERIKLDDLSKLEKLEEALKKLDSENSLNYEDQNEELIRAKEALNMGTGHSFNVSITSNSLFKVYYFENKAVLVFEYYTNSSRMGSCGEVSIEKYYFLDEHGIRKNYYRELGSNCYNDPVMSYDQLEEILKL